MSPAHIGVPKNKRVAAWQVIISHWHPALFSQGGDRRPRWGDLLPVHPPAASQQRGGSWWRGGVRHAMPKLSSTCTLCLHSAQVKTTLSSSLVVGRTALLCWGQASPWNGTLVRICPCSSWTPCLSGHLETSSQCLKQVCKKNNPLWLPILLQAVQASAADGCLGGCFLQSTAQVAEFVSREQSSIKNEKSPTNRPLLHDTNCSQPRIIVSGKLKWSLVQA